MQTAREVATIAVEEAERVLSGEKPRGLWADEEWIIVKRNPACDVCEAGQYPYLQGKKENIIKFCGSSRFQFKGNFDYEQVRKRLNGKGDWFIHDDFYIFRDRVLVKAESEKEAKKKFTEFIGA